MCWKGKYELRTLESPHVGLPELGLPLYRLIPAYDVQMILEHHLDGQRCRNSRSNEC
jgi:hypothetical protein